MADILPFRQHRTDGPRTDERHAEQGVDERHTDVADHEPEPLWRELLGQRLRATRVAQGDRLVDIAERAGISPQYLSEIERGRKEPSSEMIAAVTGALGADLADVLIGIAGQVRRYRAERPSIRPSGPVLLAA